MLRSAKKIENFAKDRYTESCQSKELDLEKSPRMLASEITLKEWNEKSKTIRERESCSLEKDAG